MPIASRIDTDGLRLAIPWQDDIDMPIAIGIDTDLRVAINSPERLLHQICAVHVVHTVPCRHRYADERADHMPKHLSRSCNG
jgi:hypothetical protein